MGSPSFNFLSILGLCISLMLAHSAGQFYTNGRYGGKRHFLDSDRHASQLLDFQLGSRYGRSDPEAAGPSGVAMIADNSKPEPERRFHANGRYGKRAPLAGPLAPFFLPLSRDERFILSVALSADRPQEDEIIGIDGSLLCRLSGLANLYRCILRKETDDSSPSYAQDSSPLSVTGAPIN